ncbi:E3 ubiquitin-protein ligase RNF169 isoform X1 [Melanerpes formicivorus]|uniref:E3 ubiquitin-protein ligase RNF169 isoform X1 n=1 Tax=Melanerpes formicivorus TaxID=211600 RepID=UPI00358FE2BB
MAAAAAGRGLQARRGRRRRRRERAGAAALTAAAAEEEEAAEEGEAEAALAASQCALCRQAVAEAVTPPCRHSLCLACFQRCLQGPGLRCPLCRSRFAARPRRHRPRSRNRPEPLAAAREQRPPEQDFIFRAPIKVRRPGEPREEYESHLRKLREEKVQEEKSSEDLLHKLVLEDLELGKRKMDEQQKKEEALVMKVSQEALPECLSDSENEEPFQGRQSHRSAFVSKSSVYSLAFLSGNLSSKVERSRSCNDTVQERSKSRQRSAPANKTKVPAVSSTSTPLLGVLSSTQNHRCLSAPDLTAEKRQALNPVSSFSAVQRGPERSISPESNDSISEELNHFKPIVCSPCTPPKRLPDGRVLSPLIIKSTPRNLSRSLQKPTTYEASPRILKKWEQIFQERQIKRTLSKATLTSLLAEPGEELAEVTHSSSGPKEQPQAEGEHHRHLLPAEAAGGPRPELDSSPPPKLGRGSEKKKAPQALPAADLAEEPGLRSSATTQNPPEVPDLQATALVAKSSLGLGPKALSRRPLGVTSSLPGSSLPLKAAGKKQLKFLNSSEMLNLQTTTTCSSVENILGDQAPALRRGRKRRCKTKHLEHATNGSLKRLRHLGEVTSLAAEGLEVEQKVQQEEEDRRLALQLQRLFDSENRTLERRRGRGGERYLLRSKSRLGAK